MMQRAGLLSEGQAASAHALSEQKGVRFVDALLELELADEDAIVAFVHSKLMIPRVRDAMLGRVGPDALRRLDAGLAWGHDVLPLSTDASGNLTLAMADPTDIRAVNTIAEHSRAYLVRAVAPVGALRQAIARYYGERPAAAPPVRTPAPPTPPQPAPAPDPSDTQTGMPRADVQASEAVPSSPRYPAHTPWNPPMLDSSQEPIPLSPEALAKIHPQLVTATDPDDVTRLLLDYLGAGFDRVIMFVHSRDELRGKDCRGRDLLPEAVRQVRIPSAGPSVFSRAIEGRRPIFGPMRTDNTIDQMFSQALGGLGGNVLVLPLQLGNRIPLVVFAHGSRHPVDPGSIHELNDAVGVALSRIVALRR